MSEYNLNRVGLVVFLHALVPLWCWILWQACCSRTIHWRHCTWMVIP